jgi:4-oxalocrotonate tautomerase
MPYVNIRITKEGATAAQKLALIEGVTDLLSQVLNKDPATTFVIVDEVDTDNWGLNRENITTRRQREARKSGGGQ